MDTNGSTLTPIARFAVSSVSTTRTGRTYYQLDYWSADGAMHTYPAPFTDRVFATRTGRLLVAEGKVL